MNPPLNIAELKKKGHSIKKSLIHSLTPNSYKENSNKISMDDNMVQQITSINGIRADPSRTVYMS